MSSLIATFGDLNPPNPLKKGAKIRILVPLKKGDLGGFTPISLLKEDVKDANFSLAV